MLLTYQVEEYRDIFPETDALHQAHFDEVACDQEEVPLLKNHREYLHLEDNGFLHIMTARVDGAIVGYIWGIIKNGLHNANTLICYTDLYFLLPEFRRGRTGIKLISEYEKSLKRRGVRKVYTTTKLHNDLDNSKIFHRLGYKTQDILFAKLIE